MGHKGPKAIFTMTAQGRDKAMRKKQNRKICGYLFTLFTEVRQDRREEPCVLSISSCVVLLESWCKLLSMLGIALMALAISCSKRLGSRTEGFECNVQFKGHGFYLS